VFLLVTLNLLLVVDSNSILTQLIVEHKSAVTGTCNLLIYGIPCFKDYCTKA
jgi:hypothetical protein